MPTRLATVLTLTCLAIGCASDPQPEGGGIVPPPRPCPAAVTEPDPPTTPAAGKPGPPDDAATFGGHAYKIYEEDVTWHEAKKRCEQLGGVLACIETAKEQAFLADLCDGGYYYLGATDEEKEGEWRWLNGAAWDYTSWFPDQPNNWGGDEHYLATYDDGDWVDVAAEGEGFWMPYGFVCEWETPK